MTLPATREPRFVYVDIHDVLDTEHAQLREPPAKKRRRADSPFRAELAKKVKQDIRLVRLGFFDSEFPSQPTLEKAYTSCKNELLKRALPADEEEMQLRKLSSAYKNLVKMHHDRSPSLSTDDDDELALGEQ